MISGIRGITAASTVVSLVMVCGVGCGTTGNTPSGSTPTGSNPSSSTHIIHAVGAENEYANVIQQIGGKDVSVTAIMSDPNTDPHTYEASTSDASAVSHANLIVQNGLGYDDFMNKLESASPNSRRTIIDVASDLGYSKNTENPHLWYKPSTMRQVATLIAHTLAKQDPSKTQYFQDNLRKFDESLQSLTQSIATLKKSCGNTPVAVTEPVSDYLLQAAAMDIKTPWAFQAAIMNGIDPSPQQVQIQTDLFKNHAVKVFIYNQQAVSDVTKTFLALAKQNHIPVVGVYETMPAHHTYQSWMEAEVQALKAAIQHRTSTVTLS